jgi:AraC family transcriptional regulator
MANDIEQRARKLVPSTDDWGAAASSFSRVGSGAGPFRFEQLTVGFVFRTLDRHEAAYGTDRKRTVPLGPGAGWLLPGGVDGQCAWDGPSEFLNISLADKTLASLGLGHMASFTPRYGFVDPTAVRIALDLHEARDRPNGSLYRQTMSLALAAHLAGHFDDAPAAPSVATPVLDDRFGRVVDYIEANLTDDMSLETLAGIAALSPFHFARSFKAKLGEPPHRFVMRRRIERAKILLRTTPLAVAEIAYRVGWDNVSHFTQGFRSMAGVTPGQFRAGV